MIGHAHRDACMLGPDRQPWRLHAADMAGTRRAAPRTRPGRRSAATVDLRTHGAGADRPGAVDRVHHFRLESRVLGRCRHHHRRDRARHLHRDVVDALPGHDARGAADGRPAAAALGVPAALSVPAAVSAPVVLRVPVGLGVRARAACIL
jgi:hypothetical protein